LLSYRDCFVITFLAKT